MAEAGVRFSPCLSTREGETPVCPSSWVCGCGVDPASTRNRIRQIETMAIEINTQTLVEEAKKAQERAHAPYSNFKVGAALLCENGAIYTACNVESKPSANTLHAEARVVAKAVEDGHDEFLSLALVTSSDSVLPPCGNCRQTLATFQEDLDIVVANEEGNHHYDLERLLPEAYTGRSMEDAPTEG